MDPALWARQDPAGCFGSFSFCIVQLPPAATAQLGTVLAEAAGRLELQPGRSVALEPETGMMVLTEQFTERAQARRLPIDPNHASFGPSVTDHRLIGALSELWSVLMPVAAAQIGMFGPGATELLKHDRDGGPPGSLLDIWRYNGHPSPCPAHTDAGLITVIAEDREGLEVCAGGRWIRLGLRPGELAVVAGRCAGRLGESGACACEHRVSQAAGRCSVGMELRPNRSGMIKLAQLERLSCLAGLPALPSHHKPKLRALHALVATSPGLCSHASHNWSPLVVWGGLILACLMGSWLLATPRIKA